MGRSCSECSCGPPRRSSMTAPRRNILPRSAGSWGGGVLSDVVVNQGLAPLFWNGPFFMGEERRLQGGGRVRHGHAPWWLQEPELPSGPAMKSRVEFVPPPATAAIIRWVATARGAPPGYPFGWAWCCDSPRPAPRTAHGLATTLAAPMEELAERPHTRSRPSGHPPCAESVMPRARPAPLPRQPSAASKSKIPRASAPVLRHGDAMCRPRPDRQPRRGFFPAPT